MKTVLLLETAGSFYGIKSGGSYIQSNYYRALLNKHGYRTKIFIPSTKNNLLIKVIKILSELIKSDYVVGFGTPLLNFYLQWSCFFLKKSGVFCVDTIIQSIPIMHDHLKRKIYSKERILFGLIHQLTNNLVLKISPPKVALANIASCKYVSEELKDTVAYPVVDKFLYPKVEIKRRKKENAKNKNILFYGALYRGRGVIDLLNACRLLWQKGYVFKLLIMGWPVEPLTEKTLMDEVKNGEKDKVIIKQKEENILKIVKDSTAVVLPFRYPCSFQTPYTLLEPMGMGVPVITTDVGSHTEWVTHGETGLICKKENPQDIADKIETVFTDSKLVDRITQGAINLLEKRYKEKDLLLEMMKKLENEI